MPLLVACHAQLPPASAPLEPTDPPAAEAGAPPVARELASVTVAAVGDVMVHQMVLASARDADRVVDGRSVNHAGFDALFEAVRDRIGAADVAFANVETPIAPAADQGTRERVFNAPPELLRSLEDTGFDVISVANNHAWDQGRPGFAETLDQVAATSLVGIGGGRTCAEAHAPSLVRRGELTLGFLAATDIVNADLNRKADELCLAPLDLERVREGAAAARAQGADLVILSVHWGIEYDTRPEPRHVEAAHAAIEAGVDVILGHHPHVLQPIEVVEAADGRRGVVVYSLGNFISNQSYWYQPGLHRPHDGNPRDGLLVTFRAVKKAYGAGSRQVVRAEVADLVATPLWTTNNVQRRPTSESVLVRVHATEDRVRALAEALGVATDPKRIVELSADLAEMQVRWETVASILGEGWVPPLPRPHVGAALAETPGPAGRED